MKSPTLALVLITSLGSLSGTAQDWPQWRGPNRDAKAVGFKVPKSWPKELTRKWSVTVGDGVSTPSLVGDKLYVFSRQDGNEVIRCLSVADGKELWVDKYDALGATGPAQSFSGPRSSPAVSGGKVVTTGVRGMISCLDAASGKLLWRKDDFRAHPNFFLSSSPLIVDGLVVAQLGGRDNGAIVAYDLATGEQKWKRDGASPAYASPVLLTMDGVKLIIAATEVKTVAVKVSDGTLAWESAGAGGGGRDNKAATPIVDGQTIIISGRGLTAVKLGKDGEKIVATDLWSNPDKSVQFNTPVLKNGLLYGLAQNNDLFCVNATDGKTVWTVPFPSGARADLDRGVAASQFFGQADPGQRGPGGPGGPGGRRGGGGMGSGGFGSIVDTGPVLLGLTAGAQLIVFAPGEKDFQPITSYKVSNNQTHAYPVASGNRIFIKDKDSVTLWTVE